PQNGSGDPAAGDPSFDARDALEHGVDVRRYLTYPELRCTGGQLRDDDAISLIFDGEKRRGMLRKAPSGAAYDNTEQTNHGPGVPHHPTDDAHVALLHHPIDAIEAPINPVPPPPLGHRPQIQRT